MMDPTRFVEKLNKVDGKVYVIEEEVQMPEGGTYEAQLQHDNITEGTLAVYTGPKLTGERIRTYTLSTPSLTPWKKVIRIQTAEPTVYISYETDGDTVEAEDINQVQTAVVHTQEAVNQEEIRADQAEQALDGKIAAETERASDEEAALDGKIMAEMTRASAKEAELQEEAENHGNDTVRHISAEERAAWTEAYDRRHTHDNKPLLDGITQAVLDTWNTVTEKVDQEAGKGLSSNDYTSDEKRKLAGIEAGAEVNAQADWNESDAASDAYIKNKPSGFPPSSHGHTALGGIDITGKTVDLNSYHLADGSTQIQVYCVKTNEGAAGITNLPVSGASFLLIVESLRWVSASDYMTKQVFLSSNQKAAYERYCTNGTWEAWRSSGTGHEDSGVTAGTYRSVTVNAKGHVTGGSNPTTLAGYGITDALKRGNVTWSQLKGG